MHACKKCVRFALQNRLYKQVWQYVHEKKIDRLSRRKNANVLRVLLDCHISYRQWISKRSNINQVFYVNSEALKISANNKETTNLLIVSQYND